MWLEKPKSSKDVGASEEKVTLDSLMSSWNSNTLATWCEELTHLKRPWCWERLKARGEGDDRGWDGWMASPTQWTWVWVNSGSWWWTGRPGVLQSMGSKRVRHDWATELNWTVGIVLLICISLMNYDVKHLFMCLLAIYIYFFGELCVQIICPFKIGWLVFLLLSCNCSLYILDTRP